MAAMTDTPRVTVYHHRSARPIDGAGPQQQAAAVWAAAERVGYEVTWVDGADLGQDPAVLLDEA